MESRDAVAVPTDGTFSIQDPDLPERERSVLGELAKAQGGRVAFQGLRRRLGLHPQALTRTLRHLEADGYIHRDENGYALKDPDGGGLQPGPHEARPVFAAVLPTHLLRGELVRQLRHRWFSGLRWFGILDSGDETILTWTTEDAGRPVRLRIGDRMLGVEMDAEPGEPAVAAVAPLLQALAALYGRSTTTTPRLTGPAQ